MHKEGSIIRMKLPEEFDKIQPSEIEIAKKMVRQYHFEGFSSNELDHIVYRLKDNFDNIEGFEPYSYKLLKYIPQYDSYGFRTFKGCLEVVFISKER